jgi:hypothetical protein
MFPLFPVLFGVGDRTKIRLQPSEGVAQDVGTSRMGKPHGCVVSFFVPRREGQARRGGKYE